MNKKILQRIKEGREPMVLVTIIDTKGSAPRHTGSKMLVGSGGILEGTVGGGKGEYNGVCEALEILKHKAFTLMDVARLGDDPRASLMICGGINRMMLQYLEGATRDAYLGALERLEAGHEALVRTDLDTGISVLLDGERAEEGEGDGEGNVFVDRMAPPDNLLILGGGYVGAALYELGVFLGFEVSVFDDREEFVTRERFPMAETLAWGHFPDLIGKHVFNDNTHVAIVTRGHLEDAACLKACIRRPNRYLGLIGSRRKVRLLMEEMREDGYGEEELGRVHAPIGLDIGAETPEEIAVSVLAEIIGEKHGKTKR